MNGFPAAAVGRLAEGVLSSTYTSKPLVEIDGEPLVGELAISRVLAQDGWTAVWADAFHGRKFWSAMPHVTQPVAFRPR